MRLDECCVPAGRLAETINFGLQGDDLLAGIAQSVDEPLVVILLGREFPPHFTERGLQSE
jgi:hypothetical protein